MFSVGVTRNAATLEEIEVTAILMREDAKWEKMQLSEVYGH